MSHRLPQLKPKELIRALERLGFVIKRQTGSHVILRHSVSGCTLPVPMHAGDIKRELLFAILREAGLSQDELQQALE